MDHASTAILQEIPDRPIPKEILDALRIYWWFANMTQWSMFGLAVIAFIASLIVTSFDVELRRIFILWFDISVWKFFAFIATLCSGLIGLLSLQTKTKDVWAAWRMLNLAVMSYKYDKDFTLPKLLEVYRTAETTIGNVAINIK
jgi:hypothetical protein